MDCQFVKWYGVYGDVYAVEQFVYLDIGVVLTC